MKGMLDNKKDIATTKEYREGKIFTDPRSWISNVGHVYLRGIDKKILRARLCVDSRHTCAICGTLIALGHEDLDHIRSGNKYQRCDCYFHRLYDGTLCTNVQLVHGMFSYKPCHRAKHHREIKWSPKNRS
jgi:hypothetical protein